MENDVWYTGSWGRFYKATRDGETTTYTVTDACRSLWGYYRTGLTAEQLREAVKPLPNRPKAPYPARIDDAVNYFENRKKDAENGKL